MTWNKKGTISLTASSLNAVGVGTTWITDEVASTDILLIKGELYEIDTIVSNTLIKLTAVPGVAVTSETFAIIPTITKVFDSTSELAQKIMTLVNALQSRDDEIKNWLASPADTVKITNANGVQYDLATPAYLSRKATEGKLAVGTGTSGNLLRVDAIGLSVRSLWEIKNDTTLAPTGTAKMAAYPVETHSQTVPTNNSVVTLNMSEGSMFIVNMNGKTILSLNVTNIPAAPNSAVFGMIEFINNAPTAVTISSFMPNSILDSSLTPSVIVGANQHIMVSFCTYDNGASFRVTPTLVS